jgi:hypothetical protein
MNGAARSRPPRHHTERILRKLTLGRGAQRNLAAHCVCLRWRMLAWSLRQVAMRHPAREAQ